MRIFLPKKIHLPSACRHIRGSKIHLTGASLHLTGTSLYPTGSSLHLTASSLCPTASKMQLTGASLYLTTSKMHLRGGSLYLTRSNFLQGSHFYNQKLKVVGIFQSPDDGMVTCLCLKGYLPDSLFGISCSGSNCI